MFLIYRYLSMRWLTVLVPIMLATFALAVVGLASPTAGMVTGASYTMDGGWSAR